jgi:hypothetical protein
VESDLVDLKQDREKENPPQIAVVSDVLVVDCDSDDQAEMRVWEAEATTAILRGRVARARDGQEEGRLRGVKRQHEGDRELDTKMEKAEGSPVHEPGDARRQIFNEIKKYIV